MSWGGGNPWGGGGAFGPEHVQPAAGGQSRFERNVDGNEDYDPLDVQEPEEKQRKKKQGFIRTKKPRGFRIFGDLSSVQGP